MGKRTWESLPGRPLAGRKNIVLTDDPDETIKDAVTAYSLQDSLDKCEKDKEIFNVITSVRGIGARAGISILSRLSADEVMKAIDLNQVELFKTIPGIGNKKAETIVFNLRKSAEETAAIPDSHKEIISALRSLGFSHKEAMQKISEISDWQKKSVADVIHEVLKKTK